MKVKCEMSFANELEPAWSSCILSFWESRACELSVLLLLWLVGCVALRCVAPLARCQGFAPWHGFSPSTPPTTHYTWTHSDASCTAAAAAAAAALRLFIAPARSSLLFRSTRKAKSTPQRTTSREWILLFYYRVHTHTFIPYSIKTIQWNERIY